MLKNIEDIIISKEKIVEPKPETPKIRDFKAI